MPRETRFARGYAREELGRCLNQTLPEELIGLVAELPDLWDVALAAWENDSQTSRFGPEGRQEPFIEGVKRLTTKPVVGVGRYTSPDRMAAVVRKGIADLVGCARPSIADPFLPKKIEEGRLEDIRECIGCNICVSGDFSVSPIRCTQSPTMGEEWRKGWHPERIRPRESDRPVLVVGAGPAGLEAAQALGKRGYEVTLAEKGTELGGRVTRECRLPGLAAWGRVRDYREQQLHQLANVEIYFDSELDAGSVLEFGFPRVVVATGARWRADGVGRHRKRPLPVADGARVLTPDDVMDGAPLPGAGARVVVWDDDHYYMGGVLAELLAERGCEAHYLTPASEASTWTRKTLEQHFIQARLLEKGVTIRSFTALDAVAAGAVTASCVFTGRTEAIEAEAVVLVISRTPEDRLARELEARAADWADAGIESVTAIGDAPATIAHAVYAGRRYAEELDGPPLTGDEVPFRRELAELTPLG